MPARFSSALGPAFLVAVLLIPSTGPAQVTTGALSGTVRDPSGAVLPGATIRITHVETGTQRVVYPDGGSRRHR